MADPAAVDSHPLRGLADRQRGVAQHGLFGDGPRAGVDFGVVQRGQVQAGFGERDSFRISEVRSRVHLGRGELLRCILDQIEEFVGSDL